VLALSVCAIAALAAENPFVGTWKMNADKSKLTGADAIQNVTVKYEMDGGQMKASVEGTNAQGQPVSFTYQAPLDGKPGTASGAPTFDGILIHQVSSHSLRVTGKKGDKVVFTDRRMVSKDGKTLTIMRSGTDGEGKAYQSTIVFDKQ
jgi:hypothetical protein